MFQLDLLLFIALNGLSFGMVLFLLAIGLVLIFGIMSIVNIAHGSYFLVGAYVGVFIFNKTGSFLLAILASMAALAFLGIITDRFFFRYIPEHLEQVFLTFGFVYILSDVTRMIWGGAPHGIPTPVLLAGSLDIMGRPFPIYRLILIALGLLLALFVGLLYGRTRLGAIMRAGVDDRQMCSAVGINIKLVSTAVFGVGALLSGLSGVMACPVLSVYPGLDWEVMTLAFVVVAVGGLKSLRGALFASLLVGMVDSFGRFLFPQIAIALVFLMLVAILIVKPTGIFGED